MTAFISINVEPEEDVDEEIDTTKELQVDDALKLFQNALKLHAQGPKFFDAASNAYDALFESEIFKYPEAATDYERAERQREPVVVLQSPAFPQPFEVSSAEPDGAASSLPQAYFLSYKNHGQFLLDRVRHRVRSSAKDARSAVLQDRDVLEDARRALIDLNAALDRDPSDAELWRRTARIAAFLRSVRTSRFCLEAAVEVDDDPTVVDVEPSSLAEGFAGQQLKQQLSTLSDDMALSHPTMHAYVTRSLPTPLKRFLDPIHYLPDPTRAITSNMPLSSIDCTVSQRFVNVPGATWSDFGMALLKSMSEHGCSSEALHLHLPQDESDETGEQMELDRQLGAVETIDDSARPAAEAVMPGTEPIAKMGLEKEATTEQTAALPETAPKEEVVSLPTRKRSQSAAGIAEPGDEEAADTKRRKRIRRRDTAAEEAMDPATLLATQLQPFQAADQNLFQTTKNFLENLGVTDKPTFDRIAEILDTCACEDRALRISSPGTRDLRDFLGSFDDKTAQILLSKKESPTIGLSTFLEHTKSSTQLSSAIAVFDNSERIRSFVNKINTGWMTIHDVAYEWIAAVARHYVHSKWSDVLKTVVVQMISRLDGPIYERVVYELDSFDHKPEASDSAFLDLYALVEMLFELHLDVYERITNPDSVVEYAVRTETKGRLGRWFDLAARMARYRTRQPHDELPLRFMWAAVLFTTLSQHVSRDHVLLCWHDLRSILCVAKCTPVYLPNNVVMPELSQTAADQEISRLTTMDFFLNLFQEELKEPVSVIDALEPVLNPGSVFVAEGESSITNGEEPDGAPAESSKLPIADCASQGLRDLWKFLSSSSTELRLMLWSRLSDAYGKIQYTTKQFSCLLRGIEMVVEDFERHSFTNAQPDARRELFMSMLKSLDDLIIPALALALNDNTAFDIIDADHIKTTSSALAKLSSMLHMAAIFEDGLRIAQATSPVSQPLLAFLRRLREMQVRTWSLQYTMFKVGVNQNPGNFAASDNDLADYLSAVHQVLGLRKSCKSSNKIFLKMMRIELLKQRNIDNWEDYLGQVLYDLHGLKLGVGIWEVQDHGCPPEKLEKRNAMQLVEKITILANRMPLKDLLKSDLKTTIDHMQQAMGQTKSTPQMIHNLRNFTEYLKKPIHPLRLYQALSGSVVLDAVAVNTSESAAAKHGWFFLQGMIALTKFKGVDLNRRQTPGATDDLRIGATFLRLQLQFTPDRWDAWFRLAECFDHELDEAVLWTADKINKDRAEPVKFQRNAIHCYTLALSNSHFWMADETTSAEEGTDALYELYHKFGMRLYASSREPFAMEAFQHADQERFFIEAMGQGTYRKILHDQMSDYKVWKFAAEMFRRAMTGRPKDWRNPYMLAKCLWKMYEASPNTLGDGDRRTQPTVPAIISVLEKTVHVTSQLPKPRHGQDPVLEPHYKILSVIHKLVMRHALPAQEGADILQRQPYAIQHGERVTVADADDWDAFVIKSLRHLRDKDKSNWQHRMIVRHARILFDEDEGDGADHRFAGDSDRYLAAKAAFLVLRESMFTKTMVMNVWKCEAERAGRHHVYTEQYVRLMVRLLAVMHDRANMEALLRRIRKKGADFYHFNELWQSCVLAYLRLLRKSYDIPLAEEDLFKTYSTEEFEIVAERIEEWAAEPSNHDNRRVAAMREAIELKKLNANLMKALPIDDLISDCYSALLLDIAPTLPGPDPAAVIEERNRARISQLQASTVSENKASTETLTDLQTDQAASATAIPTALGSLRAPSEGPEKMERQISNTGEPTHRGRRVGVRRPDILRKAEQAVTRATEGPPKSAGASGHSGKSRLGSTSSGKNANTPNGDGDGGDRSEEEVSGGGRPRRRLEKQKDDNDDADVDDADGGDDNNDANDDDDDDSARKPGGENDGNRPDRGRHRRLDGDDIRQASSSPGSLHDSADDESDLSDVPPDYDEDVPPNLLFPNLNRKGDAEADDEPGGEDDEGGASDLEDQGDESQALHKADNLSGDAVDQDD